jgi:uncharacterized protein YndB with AHSA1/START domain
MSDNQSLGISFPNDQVILNIRIYDAPRELVWKVWAEPEHVKQWWGPRGFTNTNKEHDFKVGGYWRFVMHGPDGKDFDNEIIFQEILPPEKLVMMHSFGPRFVMTLLLEDLGNGKTKLTYHCDFGNKATCDSVKPYAVPGNEQHLQCLAEYLEKMKG